MTEAREHRPLLPGDIVTASSRFGRATVYRISSPSMTVIAVPGQDEIAVIISSITVRTWMTNDGRRACIVLLPLSCTVGWTYEDNLERVS